MKKLILVSCLSFFALLSCKNIETPEGKIPADYLGVAKQFVGTYSGAFEKTPGTFTLKLIGDKPMLIFRSQTGDSDLFGGECKASIGPLSSIDVQDKKGAEMVQALIFKLEPNLCAAGILGRSISIEFGFVKGIPTGFKASVLESEEYVDGGENCTVGKDGIVICTPQSGHTYMTYLSGKFKKQSIQ